MQRNQKRNYSRQGLLVVFLIFFGSFIMAQDTDFSGEWILNESESEMGEGMFRMTKAIKVVQSGNDLELARTRTGRNGEERTSTENLTLDGEPAVTKSENRSTESAVAWSEDGKSITISSTSTFDRQGETFEMTSTEVWSLDKKGKILTINYSGSTPRGERKATLVYDKK
ncbi:MAG: hypothetical protein ISS19_18315 [Bacteroidales bacterium]|nr:hypothetical protein [Bacteroidales bacterium]